MPCVAAGTLIADDTGATDLCQAAVGSMPAMADGPTCVQSRKVSELHEANEAIVR